MAGSEQADLWTSPCFRNLAADRVRFGLVRHFSHKAKVADRSSFVNLVSLVDRGRKVGRQASSIERPASSIRFLLTNLIVGDT